MSGWLQVVPEDRQVSAGLIDGHDADIQARHASADAELAAVQTRLADISAGAIQPSSRLSRMSGPRSAKGRLREMGHPFIRFASSMSCGHS